MPLVCAAVPPPAGQTWPHNRVPLWQVSAIYLDTEPREPNLVMYAQCIGHECQHDQQCHFGPNMSPGRPGTYYWHI